MTLRQAILATLAYHDIFNYPLTAIEIHKYFKKKASLKAVENELKNFKSNSGFYTLPHREKIVKIRKTRIKFSEKKLKRAYFYTRLLKLIPTIRLVGISGALAMQNSHKNDDIDLVIICQKGTLWTTRFFANIILSPFRRYPTSKHVADRACLNIFLDEYDLKISSRNLYTAHEICQLKPIYDKQETYSRFTPVNASKNIKRSLSVYSKFIVSNKWVKKFLPNWQPLSSIIPTPYPVIPAFTLTKEGKAGIQRKKKALVVSRLALCVETLLKKFQLLYMRSKVSSERIGKHQLFFHPQDTEELILSKYRKKLKSLKITDS
ncbi:MAG: hypothetical protein Q8P25_03030 [Candidatus Curtissbacteria bacterium]|nr:hypothetical protein [Candidatus Curtissbacteria bacterium]MDZ4209590.1 hypothetical protein [Candidatus Curtissbacteria bacterium]